MLGARVEAGGWQRSYREEEERIKAEAREDLVTESRDEISGGGGRVGSWDTRAKFQALGMSSTLTELVG